MLDFVEEKPFNGKKPEKIVVFLHGYGADKYDLFGLKENFIDVLSNAQFVSVNAPFPCEFGEGYQWFSLRTMDFNFIYREIKKYYKIIIDFVEGQVKRFDLKYKDVLLIGFSQGTMMSLFSGLRMNEKLMGIIGFSGVLVDTYKGLKKDLKCKQNILLVHGTDDKVVPYEYFAQTEKLLKSLDIDFISKTSFGLEHAIDLYGIQQARNFISSSL